MNRALKYTAFCWVVATAGTLGFQASFRPGLDVFSPDFWLVTAGEMVVNALLALLIFRLMVRSGRIEAEAEAVQRKAEARFRHLLDNSSDLVLTLDAAGNVVYASAAASSVLGRTPREVQGMPFLSLVTDVDRALAGEMMAKVLSSPRVTNRFAVHLRTPSKDSRFVELLAQNLLDHAEVCAVLLHGRDITVEQRLAVDKARAEDRLEQALEAAHLGSFEWNVRSGHLHANEVFRRLLGLAPGTEAIGQDDFLACLRAENRQALLTAMATAEAKAGPLHLEFSLADANGRTRTLELHGQFRAGPKTAEMARLFGVVRDVTQLTERAKLEKPLVQANRALRMLVDCNQLIERATTEAELLTTTCRLIVEEGGYRMAWVGYAEHDAEKTVRPVAHAGHEDGYTSTARISWADNEQGQGPTGRAIRTRLPQSCRDIANEPRFAPWREAALQRGYRSLGVFPLVHEDAVLGTLNICSAEVNHFDTEESTLLAELAGDLALGLGLIRERARRQAAERSLAETAERLALALHAGNLGIYDTNLQTGEAVVNPEYALMLGYDPADFHETKAAWLDRLHPEDRDLTGQLFADYLSGKRAEYRVEFRQRTRTGEYKWLLSVGRVVERDAAGQPLRMIGTHTDITARRQADAALQASEREFRSLAESMPQIVWITRPDGWNTYFNQRWVDYTGLTLEESYGHGWIKPFHPDDQQRAWEAWQRATQQNATYSLECRLRRADGTYRWWLIRGVPQRDGSGQILKWFGTCTDIEDIKLAEAAFATFFEQPMGLNLICTLDGQIQRVNQAWELVLGRDRSAAIGANVLDFIHAEDKAATVTELARLADGITTFHFENRYRHQDGTFKTLSWSAVVSEGLVYGMGVDVTEARQSQRHLQLQAAMLENLEEGINLCRARDGLIIETNQQFDRMFGYARGELIGQPIAVLNSPGAKKPEAMVQEIMDSLEARGNWSGEVENVRKDGTRFWCQASVGVFDHAEHGRVWVSAQHDITERKRAQEELVVRSRLGEVLLRLPVEVEQLDEKSFMQQAQEFAEDLTGSEISFIHFVNDDGETIELVTWSRRTLEKFCHAADQSNYPVMQAGIWADSLREKRPVVFNDYASYAHEHGLPEGDSPLQRLISVPVIEGGRVVMITGVGNKPSDYTEQDINTVQLIGESIWRLVQRRRTEAKLQLQSAALAAAANVIVITDAKGTIEWVNDAFTRVTGYTSQEAIGNNPRVLKSGQHPPEFYQEMWRTISSGQVWHGEIHNQRKDGTPLEEEATITPVKDSAGTIAHFIAIKQDITEKRNLERQFLRAQRMESVGMLAGGIAHDLNNVLAPIRMGLELLQQVSLPEKFRPMIDSMLTSTERGAGIVKQVLTFARGTDGERAIVQLRHLIKDIKRVAEETFPRNISLHSDVTADLWPLKADPSQLHQVLLNLSVNARDAMPDGGRILYQARNFHLDQGTAKLHLGAQAGDYVLLRVTDNGMGMPKEVVDRIFEPFFTTKPQGQGTGLGLPTVLGIVRSHGGFLEVRSEPGKGTTFEVYLPAEKTSTTGENATQARELPMGHGETILVVDDEPAMIAVTRSMLEAHGYRVLVADDGAAAVAVYAQHSGQISIVVTDIMMPLMDGMALIRSLQHIHPQVRIITVSGLSNQPGQPERQTELRTNGIRHHLAKPFTVEALLNAIHEELHPA
jgi:PAS domain S-box-containing protein